MKFSGLIFLLSILTHTFAEDSDDDNLDFFECAEDEDCYCPDDGICPGQVGGDPHFKMFDGTLYSYHGQCDLVMLHSDAFRSGLGLDVHARTQIINDWSLFSNAAVMIGSDIFEVQNDGSHYFNGFPNVDFPVTLSGKYNVTKEIEPLGISDENDNSVALTRTWYVIDLTNGETIKISNFKTMLNIQTEFVLPKDSAGMLGTYRKRGMVGRDGETIVGDNNEMGAQWQVTATDFKLFHEARAPQYPEQCILPNVSSRRLRMSEQSVRRAEEACAGATKDMRNFCVDDVLLTGDVEVAYGYVI